MSFTVQLLTEDAETITLGWTPQDCDGYQIYRDGVKISRTLDPLFQRDHRFPPCNTRLSKAGSRVDIVPIDLIEQPNRGSWPAPSPAALFDGRASLVTAMRGVTRGTLEGDYMDPWIYGDTGNLYFWENDITLVPDARFGKAFRVGLNADSRNPWWVGQPADKPSAEITKLRPISIGQVDWYRLATKFQAGWKAGSWGVVVQMGYPTLTSPPLAVAISLKDGVPKIGIDRHAGIVTSGTTGLLNVEPRFHNLADVQDRWIDWLIGVRWDPQSGGWVRVETRPEGAEWAVRYEAHDTPTWQQKSGEAPHAKVNDKMGAYQDASKLTGAWENVVVHAGITRWDDEASARAALS